MNKTAILKKTIQFLTYQINVYEIDGIEYVELKTITDMLKLDFEHELDEALDVYGVIVFGALKTNIENTDLSSNNAVLIRLDRVMFFMGRNHPKSLPRPLTEEIVEEMSNFHRAWRLFLYHEQSRENVYEQLLNNSYEKIGIFPHKKGGA